MTGRIRRLLLVGFMGSGKSTVGRLVAAELGWRFRDFDACVEARAGASVAEIFERDGEAGFRALEADVARELLEEDQVVLASGGGWAAVAGHPVELPSGTLSVWLQVTPEEAVRRAKAQALRRPLLAGDDPLIRARALLLDREPRYARAHHRVDTTGATPEDVARQITALVRSQIQKT